MNGKHIDQIGSDEIVDPRDAEFDAETQRILDMSVTELIAAMDASVPASFKAYLKTTPGNDVSLPIDGERQFASLPF